MLQAPNWHRNQIQAGATARGTATRSRKELQPGAEQIHDPGSIPERRG